MARTRIVWKKSNQKEVIKKVRKLKRESNHFLHITRHLDLIHIAMEFHSDILYGYPVMMCTRIVCNILIKGH